MLRWPLMLRITVSKQGEMPRSHAFDKREITVGRTPANDLVIPEPGVSSSHARILFTGSEITLIDLESTNGTFVNGTRIQGPCILAPRDEVFICAHRLEFEVGGAASAHAPHATGRPEPSYGAAPPPPASFEPMMPAPIGQSMPPPVGPPLMQPPMAPPSMPPASIGAPSSVAPPPMAPPPLAPPPSVARPMSPPPSMPPPLAPAGPNGVGGYEPPPPLAQLGVPSPIGVGGPLPQRRPDEPPTMPPPLGPIGPIGAIDPPAPILSTPTPPPVIGVAPPPFAEAPARTGSTFTPAGGGVASQAEGSPPTQEPPASLEPVGLAPEVVPRWDPAAPSAPAMPPVVIGESPSVAPPPPVVEHPPAPPAEPPAAPLADASEADITNDPRIGVPQTADYAESAPPRRVEPPSPAAVARSEAPTGEHPPPFARSSPSRPAGVPQVIPATTPPIVRSSPSQSPVFIDSRLVESLDVEFEDLASLSGAALARAACARVFAAVHEMLVGESGVPERDAETRARARAEALRMLQQAAETVTGIEARPWAERIASEMCGLGALTARLAEPDVQEIFVHGPDRVLVRRGGGVPAEIDAKFSCPQAIEVVVRRLTATNFGAENPIIDARTLDGADVYAVHESVAHGGPVVNISLPSPSEPRWTLELLMSEGAISPVLANLFATCVQAGLGILVCAGPGARSFPLVAALLECAPATDRHVLVRPMSEMGVLPSHLVVLEGDGLVGTDGTTVMQALVRTAVGLRPDRLCVHEAAGPEVAEILAAAGRGLSGAVLSTRAGSAEAGIHRLAALAALAGGGSDPRTRAHVVARSLELVVCVARFPDGRTRVVEVAEAAVAPDGSTCTTEIIAIDPRTGSWRHSGAVPSFFAALGRRGIVVDAAMLSG